MKAIKLIPDDTNVNFVGMRFVAFVFSALLVIGSIGLTAKNGLNFGIDFTGGTMIEIRVPDQSPDLGALRTDLNALEIGAVSIQEFGAPDDLLIRLGEQEGGPQAQKEAVANVKGVLEAAYPDGDIEYRRTEFVGPQVGEELKRQGLYAILFSLAGILIYVAFRFQWQFGVAAIVALAHDIIATIGLFAVMQWEFNLSTVAAVLMIAGYSINDTVVIFDRVRENLQKFKKKPVGDVCNMSLNETLSRTVITGFTTLLALFALWYFGGEVIRGFVNALIFGIVIGTYSSIFVAAPILMMMNVRRGASAGPEGEGYENSPA